jgi:hypothetical protein
MITLHWPQITIIVLQLLGLGYAIAMHGKPRRDKNINFWNYLITSVISMTILYFGGFFG